MRALDIHSHVVATVMLMKDKQNLHTHTIFGDGVDTPEQMVRYAIEKNFDSLGFSEHSYMFYSPMPCLQQEETLEYKREIKTLKAKYSDQIKIFTGLEVDMYSQVDLSGYDYLIGSCHYFKFGDTYVGFDRTVTECQRIIDQYFGGNGIDFAREYYRQFARIHEYGDFDIVGHFDLVTKNNAENRLFDEDSTVYFTAALEAMESIRGKIPLFEVNTGSIARGYRTRPYPSLRLMKEFRNMKFGAVISSDCHNGQLLDCGFEEARKILEACGFTERYVLTDSGFSSVAL